MQPLAKKFKFFFGKPALSILFACVMIMGFLGLLMASNYKNQTALEKARILSFQLDMGKRAASIEYYFSERRYDLRNLAGSREILNFFVNKSLGMSYSYGLKVNLFLIKRILENTLSGKQANGKRIYNRFVFVDNEGFCLVDTAVDGFPNKWFDESISSANQNEPVVQIIRESDRQKIAITAPCFFKKIRMGRLIAFLNPSFLFNDFLDNPRLTKHLKGVILLTEEGIPLSLIPGGHSILPPEMFPSGEKRVFPMDQYHPTSYPEVYLGSGMVLSVKQLVNAPFFLMAWIGKDSVFSAFEPSHLLVAAGIVALLVLLGTGIIVQSSVRNMMLKTRYEESRRRQEVLSKKNQKLKFEITKRMRAENELEKQRVLRARSDRLRSLGEMAAGIAHELNQPLMGIKGMAELILLWSRNPVGLPIAKVRKRAHVILEQTDRMTHIINHVRLFARESGKVDISMEDLNSITLSGIGLIKAQLKSHGVELECDLSPMALPILVNPYSLEEVIINLIGNARDEVISKKEETISDYYPRISIRSGLSKETGYPFLEIRDNGRGIDREIETRIFDPFFTTKDPDRGTGLGLSISKSIVEEFGGKISFQSQNGDGTVFTISFPFAKKEEVDGGKTQRSAIANINCR